MRHHLHRVDRSIGWALARAAVALGLAATLSACGTTRTVVPEGGSIVTRASVSTTGVAITDVIPGPVMVARMNDAGLIGFITGSTGYVYDTRTKALTDLNDVAPCAPVSGNHSYEIRKVAQSGLVLFVCFGGDGNNRSYVWDATAGGAPMALPGLRTRAFDMNDAGTVVGVALFDFQSVHQRQRGFIWRLGDAQLTEVLPITATGVGITAAYQVNNHGQVLAAGPADDYIPGLGETRYYIVSPTGTVTVVTGIEAGGGGDRDQAQINDLGDIVGMNFVRTASPQETRVFHRAADGTMTDVGLGEVRDFNASSTVVFTDHSSNFTWNPVTQTVTEIVVPGGAYPSVAAMNDSGQVLLTVIRDGDVRALVWEPSTGAFAELGLPADVPGASRSEARAMNNSGQVVGQYLSHPTFHGVVWKLAVDTGGDPPMADAGGPYSVIAGNTVRLDGTGSSDPDEAALTFEWDLDYDGATFTVDATGATTALATTTSDSGRVITVAVRVTNPSGASDVATAAVTVLTPTEAITALIDEVSALYWAGVLNRGQEMDLRRQLINARRSLMEGQANAACSQLEAFVEAVDDRSSDGVLSEAIAAALRADADAVGSAISCEMDQGL